MTTVDYKIPSGNEILSCSVDYYDLSSKPSVICLHGGGPSSKKSTEYLSPTFGEFKKSVIRFDFSGQGESTGDLKRSSLKKRYSEAKDVLNYFNIDDELTIIGSSMGGYIGTTLLKEFKVENLILFCPAAYSTDAWDIGFSSGFTEIIREKQSFLKTDINSILKTYYGKSLFIIGEHDDIIPKEVIEIYHASLSNSYYFHKMIIKDCPHPIHRWAKSRNEIQDIIKMQIEELLSK